MVAEDIVMMQWWGRIFEQRVLLTRTFVVKGTVNPGDTTVQSLQHILDFTKATGLGTSLTDQIMNNLPSNYAMDFLRAQVVAPTRSVLVDQPQTTVTGGWGTATETTNLQGAITFRTDFGGRNQVSTIKVGPLPTDAAADGLLEASYKAELADTALRLTEVIPIVAGGFELYPVIWHRPGATYNYIRTAVTQDQVRTMRRRTVGLGI